MNRFKELVKNTIGIVRCVFAGVNFSGGVYVGRHVHFVNGNVIKLGKGVQIRPDVDLFAASEFCVGDGCDIGTRNRIVGNVIIEDNVLLGPDNYICSHDHYYQDVKLPIKSQGVYAVNNNGHRELRIGEGSWIGTHVAIIGDVHIGKHCVIGANSVVTKDVPDYCVVLGAPAKIVKRYNFSTEKWEKV